MAGVHSIRPGLRCCLAMLRRDVSTVQQALFHTSVVFQARDRRGSRLQRDSAVDEADKGAQFTSGRSLDRARSKRQRDDTDGLPTPDASDDPYAPRVADFEAAYADEEAEDAEDDEEEGYDEYDDDDGSGEDDDEEEDDDDDDEDEDDDAGIRAVHLDEGEDDPIEGSQGEGGFQITTDAALVRDPAGPRAYRATDILPLRPKVPWVSLPSVAVTLPVPADEACSAGWRWALWSGEGRMLGTQLRSVTLAPWNATLQRSEEANGRLLLPVRVSVRAFRGLVTGPVGRSLLQGEERAADGSVPSVWASAALTVTRAMMELHMLRHAPAGELTEGKGTRRPRVLHSWRDPIPTGSDAVPGMPHTLGVEYECLSDEALSVSALPAQGAEDALARLAAARAAESGLEPDTHAYSPLSPTRLITMRHAVSYTVQPPRVGQGQGQGQEQGSAAPSREPDCVHEITVSAPAQVWDTLWEGDDDDDGMSELWTGSQLPPSTVPTPAAIGLRSLGLRMLMDQATITGRSDPLRPSADSKAKKEGSA